MLRYHQILAVVVVLLLAISSSDAFGIPGRRGGVVAGLDNRPRHFIPGGVVVKRQVVTANLTSDEPDSPTTEESSSTSLDSLSHDTSSFLFGTTISSTSQAGSSDSTDASLQSSSSGSSPSEGGSSSVNIETRSGVVFETIYTTLPSATPQAPLTASRQQASSAPSLSSLSSSSGSISSSNDKVLYEQSTSELSSLESRSLETSLESRSGSSSSGNILSDLNSALSGLLGSVSSSDPIVFTSEVPIVVTQTEVVLVSPTPTTTSTSDSKYMKKI
jgi:hypothetical protein